MIETLNGIKGKLHELEPEIPIYNEQVGEGNQGPAFLVMQIKSEQLNGLNGRYIRTTQYDVEYFPDLNSPSKIEDCRSMGERLYEALAFINVNGQIRAKAMSYEIINRVLHFHVNFTVTLFEEKPVEPKMQKLEEEVRT
ncbi:hypothetical protein LOZ80_22135 [Paenibacillus sp. HWE-109]|uniref:phage tail terminator family protein n=1 Tax=Paenibacillus sp. HWE-109 TaxID=1306526 RepID=UPI001EDD7893|nr:hypothetical protein [Paenibacillus sp. HWE-109]UKS24321.1 hypothetical protein LOZ80_22135 [Paenibacillus sp. HWE-109]